MALLQISEPGQSTAPHHHNLACGIDLGTTNSLVASVMSGETKLLADNDNEVMLPSIVHFGRGRKTTIGREASDYAQADPTNTIFSIKRFMGLGFKEVSELKNCPYKLLEKGNNILFQTAVGNLSAVEISASILSTLKSRAEEALGGDLLGAVITVPAYLMTHKGNQRKMQQSLQVSRF